ncbi:MAG: acyl-CoA dehydratase activase-related protein [Promethearchaeota archaeon]
MPRALYYYIYKPMWVKFFEKIGAQVIISPKTNNTIKTLGVRFAPDEDCYNSKLYYGHVISLKKKVDYLFIPRLGSDHPVHVGCPKFISLAEVIHSMYPELPELINPYYSQAKANHGKLRLLMIAFQVGWKFTKNPLKILLALRLAVRSQRIFRKKTHFSIEKLHDWEQGKISEISTLSDLNFKIEKKPLKVALAAHRYVIHDDFASLNIYNKLRERGIEIITSEQMPREIIQDEMAKLDYNFYFEYEREILGTILYFLRHKTVDGIIQINTFSCGPDSIAGEVASQYSKRLKSVTLLQLTFDELTGEAGLNTRLEAFVDMLERKRKKKCPSHFPTLVA